MKKVFGAISVFIALCLIIAVWTLVDFDKNIRSAIVEQLSEKTGRPVVIDGEVKMHLSFSPSVEVKDIKLANAPWSDEPYMAQLGSLEVKIDLWSLFERKIKIKQISLKDVYLNFEVDQKNQKNWIFSANEQKIKEHSEKDKTENGSKKYKISAENALLENIRLSFKNQQQKKTEIQIKTLSVTKTDNKAFFD